MGPTRIYPWRKMQQSRAPSIAPGTFFVAQPWADCITNMPGFNLRQAQALCNRFNAEKRFAKAFWNFLICLKVEASSTPTICCFTPKGRHQPPQIARKTWEKAND